MHQDDSEKNRIARHVRYFMGNLRDEQSYYMLLCFVSSGGNMNVGFGFLQNVEEKCSSNNFNTEAVGHYFKRHIDHFKHQIFISGFPRELQSIHRAMWPVLV